MCDQRQYTVKYALGGSAILNQDWRKPSIRFGLCDTAESVNRAIKRADRMAAWLEATQLAGFSGRMPQKF